MQLLWLLFLFVQTQAQLNCPRPNGLFAVDGACDMYLECRHGEGKIGECPDGLLFDGRNTKLRYPCDYPVDVECEGRGITQRALPTEHCPHQYGMFRNEDPSNCGQFWNCVEGRSYLFNCPEGLAFNSNTMRCDWPDETPDCDPEQFFGFRCPPPHPMLMHMFGNNPRYPHPTECNKFFVCMGGTKPRLHTCEQGYVFNAQLNACDERENVPDCL